MNGGVQEIVPAEEHIRMWLLETLRHTNQVMYYSELLELGKTDPELPHDIAGKHNKLEWEVLRGCALGYGNLDQHDKGIFQITTGSVNLHRSQYHHRMWEGVNEDASAEDLKFGALDIICALLENRPYYESVNSLEEFDGKMIHLIADGPTKYVKLQWIDSVVRAMKKVERPAIERIDRLDEFPNIGISFRTYEQIAGLMQKALKMLRDEKGYRL